MAVDIQNVALTPSYVPYERPPQPLTLWSVIPRGLQSFIAATVLLDAKALNDDALLNLQATLPPNFGYVMHDCQVSISQDTAFNWSNIINLNLQNFYRTDLTQAVALNGNWVQTFAVNDGLTSTGRSIELRQPWPSYPMIAPQGTSGILINISASNPVDQAALAGTINAYISFWAFDLEQIRKYAINTPQPVQSR